MITVVATESRRRNLPHAFPVLVGWEAAVPGFQASLARGAAALEQQGFTGKTGQVANLDQGLIAVGVGEEASADSLRSAAGSLARSLGTLDRLGTSLHAVAIDGALDAVVEGFALGGYTFDSYKSAPRRHHVVEVAGVSQRDVDRAMVAANAEIFARDLINTPAADKAPAVLAERIADHAVAAGVAVDIWDEQRIELEKLGGLLAVGAGSHRAPRFVRLSHRPRRSGARLAMVGKGIVFDSGGLSLKPADMMEQMKTDMSGAAAVAGAVAAIARLRLPVTVEGYLPLTDNMPGGGATRPGDIIRYRNGRTIEVLNTDAEGRLVLADGLILAAEGEPDLLVDIATLTGAQRIALGDRVGAVFGTSPNDVDLAVAAGAIAGERFWPMPIVDDYTHLIESEVADAKN
ncbi:MAG: leucyl aminopeptidase family protein, partial [Actinomycetota bacterium]